MKIIRSMVHTIRCTDICQTGVFRIFSRTDNDGKAYVSSITREVSDRNKPSQKSASDATGCVSYKYEPSLFSVPSLYSLHSEISIQQLPTKVQTDCN